jgi:catechol 2,3-dioxygenase-like lactoylglutathione lyase family enzyme
VLGLRFVKRTVNFDDPGTYHLYYGDEAGRPGSILTFFPREHAPPERAGVGLAQIASFAVPPARSATGPSAWSRAASRTRRPPGASARACSPFAIQTT